MLWLLVLHLPIRKAPGAFGPIHTDVAEEHCRMITASARKLRSGTPLKAWIAAARAIERLEQGSGNLSERGVRMRRCGATIRGTAKRVVPWHDDPDRSRHHGLKLFFLASL